MTERVKTTTVRELATLTGKTIAWVSHLLREPDAPQPIEVDEFAERPKGSGKAPFLYDKEEAEKWIIERSKSKAMRNRVKVTDASLMTMLKTVRLR